MKKIPLLLTCTVLLSGCTSSPPQIIVHYQLISPHIPEILLKCPKAPFVPEAVNQAEVARYIVRLWSFGQSCRSHLQAVSFALHANAARSDLRTK